MEKEKKNRKKSHSRFRGLLIVLPILAAAAVAVLAFVYPWTERPSLGKGNLEVYLSGSRMSVTWPAPRGADRVALYRYEESTDEYVLVKESEENTTVLDGITANQELRIRLVAVRHTTNRFGQPVVLKDEGEPVTILPAEIARPVVESSAHAAEKSLDLSWDAGQTDECVVYRLNENEDWQLLTQGEGNSISLQVGEELTMPARSEPIYLAVRVLRREAGYTACSGLSEAVMVTREDLLSNELSLSVEQTGDQRYTLRWEEAQGDTCALLLWSDQEERWITVKTCDVSEELCYETGRVTSGTQQRYRLVDYKKDAPLAEGESLSKPGTAVFRADISPLYCTVWPIMKLDLMEDPAAETTCGEVPAGATLCVLEEKDDWFYVRYEEQYGYVDARYCMINLPEYLGNLVDYEIANSYASIFKVHGYHIPDITGTVIQGYETVQTADGGFLVPYLYPCAKRLIQAARAVQEDGYCLHIYDAFRPHEATRYLYDSVMAKLDMPVQEPPEEETQEAAEEDASGSSEKAGLAETQAQEETGTEDEGLSGTLPPGTVLPGGQVVGGILPDGTVIPGILPDGSSILADGQVIPAPPEQQQGAVSAEGLLRLTELLAAHGFALEDVLVTQAVGVPAAPLVQPEEGTAAQAAPQEQVQVPVTTTALSIEQLSEIFGLRIEEGYLVLPETEQPEDGAADQAAADAANATAAGVTAGTADGVTADTADQAADGTAAGMPGDAAAQAAQLSGVLPPNLPPELQAAIALRVIPQEYLLTYRISMTDHDRFRLGSFLAAVASAHNRGIALDLTLEDMSSGEDLEMQSDMHDLSHYSILAQNNENADLLADYMKAVGYQDLSSEWWHFQDDETREELKLNTYLEQGVSVEGWKKDDTGWRYRLADGSFYCSTTETIDGHSYTFDENGYCPEN